MNSISIYGKVFNIGLQNTFVYRWNFLLRSLFSLVPLAGTVFIWRAVFASSKTTIGTYDYASMIWYFLVVLMVENLVTPTEDEWQIASDIREGQLSAFLIKPMNYLGYRISLFVSSRVVYTLVTIVPAAVVLLWFRDYIVLPRHAITWPLFFLSVAMAASISFLIAYTLAMMAFWILEISTIVFILYSFEYFLSGQTFPLDIMPAWFQAILRWLPFPYELFFPVQIFLEKVKGAELWTGLAIQAGWVFLMWLASQALWRRGIQHYQAVGG
ncbi:MAG: ABC-2 family transporter protein [Verrucomicrobiota bacterium]